MLRNIKHRLDRRTWHNAATRAHSKGVLRRLIALGLVLVVGVGAALKAYWEDFVKGLLPLPAAVVCELKTLTLSGEPTKRFRVLVASLHDDQNDQTRRYIVEALSRNFDVVTTCLRLDGEPGKLPRMVAIFSRDAVKMMDRVHADLTLGGDVRRSEIGLWISSRSGLDGSYRNGLYRRRFTDEHAMLAFLRSEVLTERQERRAPYTSMWDVMFASMPFYASPPLAAHVSCPFMILRVCDSAKVDLWRIRKLSSASNLMRLKHVDLKPFEQSFGTRRPEREEWPSRNRVNDHLKLASLAYFASREPGLDRADRGALLKLASNELSSAVHFLTGRNQGEFARPRDVPADWRNHIFMIQLASAQVSIDESRYCGMQLLPYSTRIATRVLELTRDNSKLAFEHFVASVVLAKANAQEIVWTREAKPAPDWASLRDRLKDPAVLKGIHRAIYDWHESMNIKDEQVVKALNAELDEYAKGLPKPRPTGC